MLDGYSHGRDLAFFSDKSAHILAGPSPRNVYTFEFQPGTDGAGTVDDKVHWLQRQEHVLLVAPVVLGPRPAAKP